MSADAVDAVRFGLRIVLSRASAPAAPPTRVGGAAGALARDNTIRNPKRTASTASALMIGLEIGRASWRERVWMRDDFATSYDKRQLVHQASTSTALLIT